MTEKQVKCFSHSSNGNTWDGQVLFYELYVVTPVECDVAIKGLHIIRSRKGSEDRTLSQWRTITVFIMSTI